MPLCEPALSELHLYLAPFMYSGARVSRARIPPKREKLFSHIPSCFSLSAIFIREIPAWPLSTRPPSPLCYFHRSMWCIRQEARRPKQRPKASAFKRCLRLIRRPIHLQPTPSRSPRKALREVPRARRAKWEREGKAGLRERKRRVGKIRMTPSRRSLSRAVPTTFICSSASPRYLFPCRPSVLSRIILLWQNARIGEHLVGTTRGGHLRIGVITHVSLLTFD